MPALAIFNVQSQQGTNKINGTLPTSYFFMFNLATFVVSGNQ